jgi:hypothetical protein
MGRGIRENHWSGSHVRGAGRQGWMWRTKAIGGRCAQWPIRPYGGSRKVTNPLSGQYEDLRKPLFSLGGPTQNRYPARPDHTTPVYGCGCAIFVRGLRNPVDGHFGADCERQCLSRLASLWRRIARCGCPVSRTTLALRASTAVAPCASSLPSAGLIEACGAAPTSVGPIRTASCSWSRSARAGTSSGGRVAGVGRLARTAANWRPVSLNVATVDLLDGLLLSSVVKHSWEDWPGEG